MCFASSWGKRTEMLYLGIADSSLTDTISMLLLAMFPKTWSSKSSGGDGVGSGKRHKGPVNRRGLKV